MAVTITTEFNKQLCEKQSKHYKLHRDRMQRRAALININNDRISLLWSTALFTVLQKSLIYEMSTFNEQGKQPKGQE